MLLDWKSVSSLPSLVSPLQKIKEGNEKRKASQALTPILSFLLEGYSFSYWLVVENWKEYCIEVLSLYMWFYNTLYQLTVTISRFSVVNIDTISFVKK